MYSTHLKTLIENAIKAPSGHNTQPWLFEMNEGHIKIIPNFSRALPIVDHDHRELFISLGCAVENTIITANSLGYETKITINDHHHIILSLQKKNVVSSNKLQQTAIIKRQTNRNLYNNQIIISSYLARCIPNIVSDDSIKIYTWQKQTQYFDILKQAVIDGNNIQMNNPMFLQELVSWMRFNKRQAESTNDGLSYAVFGAPNLPLFIAKFMMKLFLNSKRQNKNDIKKIDSSSHFVLFTTKHNRIEEWINLGRYLQQFLLALTKENIAHAYMNQPCEVIDVANQLRHYLPIYNEYPSILLRIGYSKAAPYSRRKKIDEVIVSTKK